MALEQLVRRLISGVAMSWLHAIILLRRSLHGIMSRDMAMHIDTSSVGRHPWDSSGGEVVEGVEVFKGVPGRTLRFVIWSLGTSMYCNILDYLLF